jgi:hypothetical protein
MSVCSNCGTSQGPFRRDPDFPNKPVCTARRKSTPQQIQDTIRHCLDRRAKRDANEANVDR